MKKRISYTHAKAVVNNYKRRVEAAEGTGKRVNKSADIKACEAYLEKIEAADHKVVNDVLDRLDRRESVSKTKRRLDAFARTNTPLPAPWIIEDDKAEVIDDDRGHMPLPDVKDSFDLRGLTTVEMSAVRAAANAMADAFRLTRTATATA